MNGSFKLSEEEWGWKRENDILLPIITDMEIAPECLLKVVRFYFWLIQIYNFKYIRIYCQIKIGFYKLKLLPLLQVRCNCKSTSKNQCGTNTCSCRKHGLMCSDVCKGCHGETCNNKIIGVKAFTLYNIIWY